MEAIDELRDLAKAFPEASTRRTLLMQAADTIWELRCKLAGVVDQRDEIERLKAENAKLRDLARIMHSELVSCEDNGYVCGGHKFDERVRELGIEVSE